MPTYIKLNRKLKEKAFYSKDSEKVHLWIHLLMSVNWSEKEEYLGGKTIICKPGQFTTSRKLLSKQTGISESKIERILSNFEKIEQQIEQQKTSTNRLITVLNWEQYQQLEQPFEQRPNNDRTTSEQRVNTSKEYIEIDYKSVLCFEEFWNLYDKKVGSLDKLKNKYKHISENDRILIKEHIPKYIQSQPEKQFRKNPEVYLNNKSWNDEIIIKTQTKTINNANNRRDLSQLDHGSAKKLADM